MAAAVLILRPVDKAGPLAERLRRAGYAPRILPLTEIAPLPHDLPDGIGGFVITSPSAAMALPASLAHLPVFAVGAASAAAVRARGFRSVETASGTARGLVDDLAGRRGLVEPLVWLSGEDVSTDLAADLRDAGKDCRRVIVYANRAIVPTAGDLAAALTPPPDAILLQSAKAARLLDAAVARIGADLGQTALVSLSPRIDAHVEETGLGGTGVCRLVAATPDDTGLLAELVRLGQNRTGER
ncbi:MAG: uroporphyrinogen-III synthase [Alphaproteobacteria bacterium]|nr:uroporphyrinogen-III synthase [Alphaproteobacteria bacterium]